MDNIKELKAAQAKVAALEASILAERRAALAALPAEYGYDDVNAFIDALRSSVGKKRGRKPGSTNKSPRGGGTQKRTRVTITEDIRAQVKKLLLEEKTGQEIAKKAGISLASVQNIKSSLGLVNKRK